MAKSRSEDESRERELLSERRKRKV